MKKILLLIILFNIVHAYSQTITTIAGNGTCCTPVDGVQATTSSIYYPNGVVVDAEGNILISACIRIRKVDTLGIITTIAGTTGGYSGDGGPATSAELESDAMAVDVTGNLYISDEYHNVIRKINTAGIISTIAGVSGGIGDFSGDGGPAIAAKLHDPVGIAIDAFGNLYIADSFNNRIRKVNVFGVITTIAGNGNGGFSGDGGIATSASLNTPVGITVDSERNLYIADWQNNRIRKVTPSGIISTVAGNGTAGYSGDGGQATATALNNPSGVACDSYGNLYIADVMNNRVRMVNTSGIISTVAGDSLWGYNGDGGPATEAKLNEPWGITIASGNLYIADMHNYRIRKVNNVACVNENSFNNSISIYPNPTYGKVNITALSNTNETINISLYNEMGVDLYHMKQTNYRTEQLSLEQFPCGIYFIRIETKKEIVIRKVIKL